MEISLKNPISIVGVGDMAKQEKIGNEFKEINFISYEIICI